MIKQQVYQTYKEQSVMTMTPAEMLTMLYDGILKELSLAKIADASTPKDIPTVNKSLQKAHRILLHLKNSLDMNYDIAIQLYSLYDYFDWVVTQANMKKDMSGLDEVMDYIGQLRESYIEADRKVRMHA